MNRWLQRLEAQRSQGEDVDAQVDGDASPLLQNSQFALAPGQQPWLREGLPPWHMWGNTQLFPISSGAFGSGTTGGGQLNKVGYKRPDTWHWLFVAKIVKFDPLPTGVQTVGIALDFDVIVGLGRSMSQLAYPVFAQGFPSFERFLWEFDSASPQAFINQPIYSTQVAAPNKKQGNIGLPLAVANPLNQLTAQDIQVACRINPTSNNNYVYDAQIEVSGFWAPKTHVRPDWFNTFDGVPPEKVFGGSETEGR